MLLIWWTHPALGVRLQLLLIRSHSTRQSFISPALASPPVFALYRYLPPVRFYHIRWCGYSPSRYDGRKEKTPYSWSLHVTLEDSLMIVTETKPNIRKLYVDPMCMRLLVSIIRK